VRSGALEAPFLIGDTMSNLIEGDYYFFNHALLQLVKEECFDTSNCHKGTACFLVQGILKGPTWDLKQWCPTEQYRNLFESSPTKESKLIKLIINSPGKTTHCDKAHICPHFQEMLKK